GDVEAADHEGLEQVGGEQRHHDDDEELQDRTPYRSFGPGRGTRRLLTAAHGARVYPCPERCGLSSRPCRPPAARAASSESASAHPHDGAHDPLLPHHPPTGPAEEIARVERVVAVVAHEPDAPRR